MLPGRSDNDVKNRYHYLERSHSSLKKRRKTKDINLIDITKESDVTTDAIESLIVKGKGKAVNEAGNISSGMANLISAALYPSTDTENTTTSTDASYDEEITANTHPTSTQSTDDLTKSLSTINENKTDHSNEIKQNIVKVKNNYTMNDGPFQLVLCVNKSLNLSEVNS